MHHPELPSPVAPGGSGRTGGPPTSGQPSFKISVPETLNRIKGEFSYLKAKITNLERELEREGELYRCYHNDMHSAFCPPTCLPGPFLTPFPIHHFPTAHIPSLPPYCTHSLPPSLLHTFPPSLLHTFPPSLLHAFPPSLLHTLPPSLLHAFPPSLLDAFPPSLLDAFPPSPLHTPHVQLFYLINPLPAHYPVADLPRYGTLLMAWLTAVLLANILIHFALVLMAK